MLVRPHRGAAQSVKVSQRIQVEQEGLAAQVFASSATLSDGQSIVTVDLRPAREAGHHDARPLSVRSAIRSCHSRRGPTKLCPPAQMPRAAATIQAAATQEGTDGREPLAGWFSR